MRLHRRRSVRLGDYDYTQPGAYFVTICTHEKSCLFGEIIDKHMKLNKYGKIVHACWNEIPRHFANVKLDEFVVMPNHLHGIIVICDDRVGATHGSPLRKPYRPSGPRAGSIGAIIAPFKQAVTRHIRKFSKIPNRPIWQRNYHDRIIRESELNPIRQYILDNPANWDDDDNNPNYLLS